MKSSLTAVLLVAFCTTGFAQPESEPRFDVASLKAVTLQPGQPVNWIGIQGGPGSRDPGQVEASYATVRALLSYAYGVRSFQIVGPAWIDSERYNITAKIAAGSTTAQVKAMMRSLLAERFKLEAHRGKKDLPVYALTVGKEELKLKPGGSTAAAQAAAPASGDAAPGTGPKIGDDGFPTIPAGALKGGSIINFRNGNARLQGREVTMESLAGTLTGQLDRLVVDETGLKGTYDLDIYWKPDPASLQLHPQPVETSTEAAEPGSELITAIRQQVGLRVVPKKAPVDVVLIDHMEKVATEN